MKLTVLLCVFMLKCLTAQKSAESKEKALQIWQSEN